VHLCAAADCDQEIRLELDESKLNGIIMELDILHRAVAPEIVEFFGAFTIESCVYYCMEFMDAGSLDTLTGGGVPAKNVTEDTESAELRVPEPVLRRITAGIVRGLKFLKDELQIMHRGESASSSGISRILIFSQAVRLWGFRSAGEEFGKDQHWLPELHGGELPRFDESDDPDDTLA
jgi:serine/threonine protein kinase